MSGSTGLSGGADGILVLKRDRGRADAYLPASVTGREIEEEAELALRWDANLASWSLAGDADEYRLSNERQQLLQALQNAQALMSPRGIAEATEKTVGSVKVLLGEMVKAGQVANPSYGKYGLPSTAPYSPYSANSDSTDESGAEEEKSQSKGTYDTAEPVICLHGYPGGEGCYSCDLATLITSKDGDGR